MVDGYLLPSPELRLPKDTAFFSFERVSYLFSVLVGFFFSSVASTLFRSVTEMARRVLEKPHLDFLVFSCVGIRQTLKAYGNFSLV
jgi:hypothetical protein